MFQRVLRNRSFRMGLGALLVVVLGLGAYSANRPPAPLPPSSDAELLELTRGLVEVVYPAPETVPGDNGDIRISHQPMRVLETIQEEPSPFRFAEIAAEAGLDFRHVSGMTDERHFPSANGSGVALFDYDGDGKIDVYLASCTYIPVGSREEGRNRLFRNLGGNRFEDVTERSGLGFRGFCHGVIAGDLDNDGDADVLLCNYGPNRLYRNNGDGTFTDVTEKAGIERPDNWSSGGALLDMDDDGDIDIFVTNYGFWRWPEDDHFCGDKNRNFRLYCSPTELRPARPYFFRNNGDGTFTDVYDAVIKPQPRDDGHGFGVVTADINGDGKIDLFVANDTSPNNIFLNNGDGTFTDETDTSGAGYGGKGQVQSGMGADAEDVDGDGQPELMITNFENQYNTIYHNLGDGRWLDATESFGMATDTMTWVGWGMGLVDLDSDGWPDNFVANGHVDSNVRLFGRHTNYEEPPLLFANVGGQRFRLATRDAGPYFATQHVGRGTAFADLDDDGDIDIVVNQKDGPPALLRNDTPHENRWIRLELRGTRSNRDAIGARIEVVAGGRTIHRQRKGGGSMESTNDPRVLIGLGPVDEVEALTIRWPSGTTSRLEHLATGQTHRITEPGE